MNKFILILFFSMFGFFSCQNSKNKTQRKEKPLQKNSQIKYAKGFQIDSLDGYRLITIFNPWKNNEVMRRYALISKGKKKPEKLDADIRVVTTPVHRVAVFSNTHLGSIEILGLQEHVIGLSKAHKVYDSLLYQKVQKGEIVNLGGAHNRNMDVEKIIDLNPDLIFLSGYNEMKTGESQLNQIGFPMAYAQLWMEESPLGRAEWMKFTAAFFEKDQLADSLFTVTEKEYLQTKELVKKAKNKPSVLLGWSYKGTWYMPGGNNYMVHYLKDAGAKYFLSENTDRGNLPMSVEEVLDQCKDADYWLCPGMCKSRQDIRKGGEIFMQFKAFQENEVYHVYKRQNQQGGTDWWESAGVYPQRVLKDMIKILHPELLPDDELFYMEQCK